MHCALIARRDIKVAVSIESKARGVDESRKQDMHLAIGIDLEDRHRSLLASASGESDEDLACLIHGGAADSMDILRQQSRNVEVNLVAARAVAKDLQPGRLLGSLRDAHDQAIVAGEQHRRGRAADRRERSLRRAVPRDCSEVRAENLDLSSGQCGVRAHEFDARVAR
jgi:hypothetical protein